MKYFLYLIFLSLILSLSGCSALKSFTPALDFSDNFGGGSAANGVQSVNIGEAKVGGTNLERNKKAELNDKTKNQVVLGKNEDNSNNNSTIVNNVEGITYKIYDVLENNFYIIVGVLIFFLGGYAERLRRRRFSKEFKNE